MTPSKIASYEFLNFHLLRNNPVWSIPRMSLSLHVLFVVHDHWMWILACFIIASVYRVLTNHVLDCSVTMACDHYRLPSGCRHRYNLFFCSHLLWLNFFIFYFFQFFGHLMKMELWFQFHCFIAPNFYLHIQYTLGHHLKVIS